MSITAFTITTSVPQVIVEEPRRLPAPITISYYKPPPKSVKRVKTTVNFMEKSDRWGTRKRQTYEPPPKKQTGIICRWYKRRKALKLQKKCEEYELRRLKQLMDWEEARERAHSVPPPKEQKWVVSKEKSYKSLPPPKKKLRIKDKSASVKPCSQSKCVSVKKYKSSQSLSNKCANCFYRACCKFYCYINCIILVIVIVVLLL